MLNASRDSASRRNNASFSHSLDVSDERSKNSCVKCDISVVLILMANCLSYVSYILIAPFLPPRYSEKGVSPLMIGAIFAGQSMAATIWSPVVGKYLERTGTAVWLIGGFVLMGVSFLAFGFTANMEDPTWLGISAILIRIVQGIGMGSVSTACYSIAANNYPGQTEQMIGLVEASAGLGTSAGPAFGGLLFTFLGYEKTFYTYGTINLVFALALVFLFPKPPKNDEFMSPE